MQLFLSADALLGSPPRSNTSFHAAAWSLFTLEISAIALTEISEQMQKLLQCREIQTKTPQFVWVCKTCISFFLKGNQKKKKKNIGCEISYMHRINLMNEITDFG